MAGSRTAPQRSPARPRGFTIVELAIVLAVIAVLSVSVVPSIVQQARDGLAERTVTEMVHIQDAAKAFFLAHATDSNGPTWPGQATPTSCNAPLGAVKFQLVNQGYLDNFELTNPWGRDYEVTLRGIPPDGCGFEVATAVPDAFQGFFEAYLPEGKCTGCAIVAGAGQVACCAMINKPGIERMLQEFVPQTSQRICEQGFGGTYEFSQSTGSECRLPTAKDFYNCQWRSGYCWPGERAVGATCGKNCGGNSRVQCCRVAFGGP